MVFSATIEQKDSDSWEVRGDVAGETSFNSRIFLNQVQSIEYFLKRVDAENI